MAGYMRKLQGHVYDGSNLAAEDLENGVFAEITTDGVKKTTAAKDTKLRVVEKTTLWGMNAIVADVVSVGEDEVFFVENEWDLSELCEYDTAKYTLKTGRFVKMHRPLPGEQMIFTVADDLHNTLNVGDTVQPAADGTVAKA